MGIFFSEIQWAKLKFFLFIFIFFFDNIEKKMKEIFSKNNSEDKTINIL